MPSAVSGRELAAVIFDMDGVVIDSQAAADRILVEAAAKHGVRLSVAELEDLVGASERQFWPYVKERYRLPEPIAHYAASYDEDRGSSRCGHDAARFHRALRAEFAARGCRRLFARLRRA